jgi:hypothetical protein
MRRIVVGVVGLVLIAAVAALAALGPDHATARAKGVAALKPIQQRLVSGFARRALEEHAGVLPSASARRSEGRGHGTGATGCPVDRGDDVRLNQDCLNQADPDLQGRGQAQNETAIAQDPYNPRHLVASANDYRRGDGNCYGYQSRDGGRTWNDSTVPMSFTRGAAFGGFARQYWGAGGDTSVAWDTKGNAYLSCQVFNRGQPTSSNPDLSSAFYVFRSTGTGGSSWNFPGRPVAELSDTAGTGDALLDKQYIAVDAHKGSPFQDRVYVTWTFFADDGTSYIYAAHSSDYAEHFSAPVLVSKTSAICSNDQGVPTTSGTCNTNQFSQPFTGPDGALYVAWDNYNVTGVRPGEGDEGGGNDDGARTNAAPAAVDNRAQVLLAKSTDGGATFSAPVKVADYYDLPDCQTYQGQDFGVACVPEKQTSNSYFRAADYPSAGVNPRNPREIDVTFGSYINRHSDEANGCVPQGYNPDTFQPLYTGVKTAGACNNDVLLSRSTNGGRSFTGTATDVRRLPSVRPGDPRADQFWQWAAFDPRGRLAVSFYDRAYGRDEANGFSDVTLSGTRDGSTFGTRRVTTSSMPPATQFEGAFFGDYSGLTAEDGAHPAWMDTRDPNLITCRDGSGAVATPPRLCTTTADNADPANDENVYTRSLAIPAR